MNEKPRLVVLVDGAPLPEDEARALWTRFSEYMDEHRGDMAGFAKLHGYLSVAPEARGGQAVLVVRTAAGASKPSSSAKPSPSAKPSSSSTQRSRAEPDRASKPKRKRRR